MTDTPLIELTDKHFIIDMMYARPDNMTGRAVYQEIGYGNHAYMHKDTAERLLSLIPVLEAHKLKMRICDAYRPPLAHNKLLEIIPMEGFFAKDYQRSNHCHGTAVDVCLTDLFGNNLIYPTNIDAYEKKYQQQVLNNDFSAFTQHLIKARHDYMDAIPKALQNRLFLKELMETHGFSSIMHEWWHYNLQGYENYPLIDWPF